MYKIAIKFGNNDYLYTFQKVLEILKLSIEGGNFCFSKKEILQIINKISFGCYLLFQNKFEYNSNEAKRISKKDLKIKINQILIDEQVDKYLLKLKKINGYVYDNSETFILDLRRKKDKIYSV